MGEARHHGRGVPFGLVEQGADQLADLPVQPIDRLAHPKPEVGRDLVVARARGVQPPGGLADDLLEARLDIRVDVLERRLEGEIAGLDLGANPL